MWRLITILLLLIHNLCLFPCQSTYPIDWSLVPSVQPSALTTKNTDIGPCICDLTYNSCDSNCVCDPDCSQSELARFSGSLPAGPVSITVYKCIDEELIDVNERGGVTTQLLNNVLCVVDDNNPSKGVYFNPPAPNSISASSYQSLLLDYPYNYDEVDNLQAVTDTGTVDSFYKVNDIIRGGYFDTVSSKIVISPNGYLPLIGPDSTSTCNKNSYFSRYLNNSKAECISYTTDILTTCNSIYNGNNLLDANIRVGNKRASSPTVVADYVNVELGIVYHFDVNTTSLTEIATLSSPSWDPVTNTCLNSLKSAKYNFIHEPNGVLTRVVIDVTVMDYISTDGTTGFIMQDYTYYYNLSNSLVEPRPKSGNPGYLLGKPVITGNLVSNGALQAIDQDINGMQLLRKSHVKPGECNKNEGSTTQLTFGKDSYISCSLPLTLAELQARCQPNQNAGSGLFDYLNITSFYIGVWGNSNYLHINDFISIQSDSTLAATITAIQTYNDQTRVCQGIVNNIGIELVAAEFGSVNNPQWGIISAKFTHSTTNWYRKSFDPLVAEYYPISITINWIMLENWDLKEYVPPAPPVLPKFPNDLLYPLFIPGKANYQYNTHTLTGLIASFILIIGFQYGWV